MIRLVIASALVIASGALAEPETHPPVVGVIAPLTGPAASSGRWIVQGMEIAKGELRKAGRKVPLIEVQDDGCTSQGGLNAYQALRRKGVSLIVGPVCNASAVPLIAPSLRDGVTLIATGVPSHVLMEAGDSVFTVLPPIRSLSTAIVEFAVKSGASRPAILYTPDEFGEENFRAFSESVAALGKQVTYSEQFAPGSMDFRNFLLKANQARADSYLVAAYVVHYVSFLKQASVFNSRMPLFAVGTFQSPEVAALPPSAFPIFYSYPSGNIAPSIETVRHQYLTEYRGEGNAVAMHVGSGRDALLLAAHSLERCSSIDSQCLRRELLGSKDFAGMNGAFSFDVYGNRLSQSVVEVRQLVDGKFQVVGRTTASSGAPEAGAH